MIRFFFPLSLLLLSASIVAVAQTDCDNGAAPLRHEQPSRLTPQQIIQSFAENESRTEAARRTYSFTQDVTIQTLQQGATANDWQVDGEYRSIMNITHDAHGKRIESVKFAPQSTLQGTSLTPEDYEDIRQFAVFAMTAEELPRYNVAYAGQQHVDELDTYVFDVTPKTIEKGRRYFQGRLWVEAVDLQVVKSCGKSVPDVEITQKKRFVGKKVVGQGVQPTFATYRELIDGKYWFPTYSRSDDVLQFGRQEVHLKERIRYSDYKALGSAQQIPARALSTEKRPH